MDSILNSVKSSLGIPVDVNDFDIDLIININSAFFILNQLGVGTKKAFVITGKDESFDDFISDPSKQSLVKQYLVVKTKINFDPPSSTSLLESLKETIKELEYRLLVEWGVH